MSTTTAAVSFTAHCRRGTKDYLQISRAAVTAPFEKTTKRTIPSYSVAESTTAVCRASSQEWEARTKKVHRVLAIVLMITGQ